MVGDDGPHLDPSDGRVGKVWCRGCMSNEATVVYMDAIDQTVYVACKACRSLVLVSSFDEGQPHLNFEVGYEDIDPRIRQAIDDV